MTPQVALSTSDWIFLAGVIFQGLAFVGVIVSLLLLRAQGLTARDATLAVAYQNMAAQMADVARFFVDNSDLRPYFFGNKALPASRDEHNRVLAVAEMYVNLMDNVLTQSPVLKRAGIAADWEAYFLDVYRTSPVIREFWSEHGSAWYTHSPLASLYTPTRLGFNVDHDRPGATPVDTGAAGSGEPSGFRDRWVERGPHRIHVRERDGEDPAIVLMHGFPDNHHLYDRLVTHLRRHHVVVFDFLGWGESDKPVDYDYTFANQVGDLDAVVNGLGLHGAVLVVHDASGPAGINWALDHPQSVGGIVALNTFYSLQPDAPPKPPEAIRLFSDPNYARLTEHFAASPREFRWLYDFQVGGFILNKDVRKKFVPLLYRQFEAKPSTLQPFLALNRDLNAAVIANTERTPELASFPVPVRFAFGERDQYLDPALARTLAGLFERGEVTLIEGAGHFPQLDAPQETANAILSAPTTG